MDNPFQSIMDKHTGGQSESQVPETSGNIFQKFVMPESILEANNMLGKQNYNGYCQSFVEDMAGKGNMGASAAEAWNNNLDNAVGDLEGVSPGDFVYFAPDASNDNNGHVGIYEGNGKFISATYNGVQSNKIDDWTKTTGQKVLGYVKK